MVRSAQAKGKLPIVNIDLVEGLASDAAAVAYLANALFGPFKLLTTQNATLRLCVRNCFW